MRKLILSASMLVPVHIALAQPVPALQVAQMGGPPPPPPAATDVPTGPPIRPASLTSGQTLQPAPGSGDVPVPKTMPPKVQVLAPNGSLNQKEQASVRMSAQWRNRTDAPVRSEDGVLRWVYGSSQPVVVCAPVQVCDIALAPGEVVNSIHLGDKVRWSVMPAVTGIGADRVTHMVVKPFDANLTTEVLVYTDQRVYSIKLRSTQAQYTPMTAFVYPEAAQAAWANYGAAMGGGGAGANLEPNMTPDPMTRGYSISGRASWRPVRAWNAGGKTIIEFPDAMRWANAPVLVGLANDGGWFSSPSEIMVRYRVSGTKYIVDGQLERAALIVGVGGSQEKVELRRVQP